MGNFAISPETLEKATKIRDFMLERGDLFKQAEAGISEHTLTCGIKAVEDQAAAMIGGLNSYANDSHKSLVEMLETFIDKNKKLLEAAGNL